MKDFLLENGLVTFAKRSSLLLAHVALISWLIWFLCQCMRSYFIKIQIIQQLDPCKNYFSIGCRCIRVELS